MYGRILRLIVIVWLMLSPFNVTAADLQPVPGAAPDMIGLHRPIDLLSPINPRPSLRQLEAGEPQTVALEIAPAALIANSNATAVITATVYDLTGEVVSGVALSGFVAPAARGSLSGLGVTGISGTVTGTWTVGTVVGSGSIEIGNGLVSGTVGIELTTGALSAITVTPGSLAIGAGLTTTFTAAGADAYGNAITITPSWESNVGVIDAGGVFTAPTSVSANRLVTATDTSISGTASVDIIAGPLSSIVVSPTNVTLVVSSTQVFTAAGFDSYGNAVAITPTWTTDGGTISAQGVFTAQTGVAANRLVTATHEIISATANISLIAGPLKTITVTPTGINVMAGLTQTFTANGFDQFGNSVPVTPTWTTNGGSVNASGVLTAQSSIATNRTVVATQSPVSGSALFNVIAGPLHSIVVSPSNTNVTAGSAFTFTASGFDRFGNSVSITPTWNTNGGTISSGGVFTAQTTAASGRLVWATQNSVTGLANVNVVAGTLSSIVVSPTAVSLAAGTTQAFTARGQDQYGNTVAIAPSWTTNGGAISSGGIFTAQLMTAVGRLVTATHNTVSGTASVNVIAGALTAITVTPASATLIAGASQLFSASGADQYGNVVLITPTWTTNGGTIDAGGVFTAQTSVADGRLITATHSAVTGTADVDISAGPLNQIVVTPAPVTVTVGTSETFSASGVDQFGNSVLLTPTWSTNGGTINASGVFTAQTSVASDRRVTATQGITLGYAVVNVQPGAPFTLTLQPPTRVISAGQRITYTAIATDSFGNGLGTVTGSTTFSITPASGAVFVNNSVTPTIKNTWLVTGVYGSAVGTSVLTVTAAAYNRLSVENAPAGTGTPVNTVTLSVYNSLTVYAVAYDVYNNLIGARSSTWSGTGVVAGRVSPTSGISTTFTPVVSGTGTIRATSSSITDNTSTITVQAPLLRISKTASPDPLPPGTPLQYTIIYTNAGNAPAQNVIITETYPVSTSFFSAVPAPTTGSSSWSIGTLAVNELRSIVVFLTTPAQMPVGSLLTNTVQMGADKVATASYTTATPVNALPALSASVSDAPDPARPGDLLIYTIQYRNDGTAPVTTLRITETYPAEVVFESATPEPDIGNNVWLTSTLNGLGDSRLITVRVRVISPITPTTILNNRVVVSAQETPPFTTTQQTLVVAPRLELDQAVVPVTPTANNLLTYTLRYTNTGSSYAANTLLTATVPLNTSFVQCQPGGCTANAGNVLWNLGQVDQQTTQTVTLTVQIANNLPDGTVITGTGRITSADNVTATTLLTTTVASAPDVTLSKSDGLTELTASQLTTYVINYANIGTAPAANVVITDQLPEYMTFVDCLTCVAAGDRTYTFVVGTVAAGTNQAVTMSARLTPTLPAGLRVVTNTAHIVTSITGDNLMNNVAEDLNDIATRPELTLTVAYDSSTPYPGKTITYTLHYTNTSAMDTTGVVLSTTRPGWLAGPPSGWIDDGGHDLHPLGNLPAGAGGTLTYIVTLPPTFTLAMTALPLTFTIHDDGPGGLPIAPAAEATLIGIPDLSIEHVMLPAAISPGTPFTVTVVVRNHGTGKACNPRSTNCTSGTWMDAFVDPATPPASYPFQSYGDPFTGVPAIGPGLTATITVANIMFMPMQDPILYFKIDNYSCTINNSCLPNGSLGGLVPEFNETNNVIGPIRLNSYQLYLPVIRR